MGLSFFNLQHKKKIQERETLTHTFTKRTEDKANQNNNNKKIERKIRLKGRDENITC